MSITYDALKEAQEVRQSKFSQALKKSSLENVPAQARNFKGVWVFLVSLILAVSIGVFFTLRGFSPREKVIIPAKGLNQSNKSGAKAKVKARKLSTRRTSHLRIKKKETGR